MKFDDELLAQSLDDELLVRGLAALGEREHEGFDLDRRLEDFRAAYARLDVDRFAAAAIDELASEALESAKPWASTYVAEQLGRSAGLVGAAAGMAARADFSLPSVRDTGPAYAEALAAVDTPHRILADPSPKSISVLLVEDAALLRVALSDLLTGQANIDVVAALACGDDVMQVAVRLRPDVVIVDLASSSGNGLATVLELRMRMPAMQIIALSERPSTALVQRLKAAGILTVIDKNAPAQRLVEAIHEAGSNSAYDPTPLETFTSHDSPRGMPIVWGNVPPRNPNFTGRNDLLHQLSLRLTAGGTTAIVPSALHGMGGIGKTQIAAEYIYRHLNDYEIVWWIQATQPAQVRAALTELAQRLHLPGASEASTAVPAVLEALRLGQPHRRWLLVFDAAESPNAIGHFFPTNGPGKILITSRNPEWASVARPLEVAMFHRDESIELLKRRGPGLDEKDAIQLAEKLGDLPLAVEQAAAWRAETGMPIRQYLRMFDEKVAEILDTSAPTGYEVSVAAAWNVSFDELKIRSPAAHQLLQVCAFFSPEPISRNLFTDVRGVSISPDLDAAVRDPMQLSRSIRDIARYGLAKIDHRNGTFQLHRLVQQVLRNRMSTQVRAEKQHGAHVLLANYDPNDPKSAACWPRYREIVAHVDASELTDCDDAWVRQLVLNLMQYLYCTGDYDEAAALSKHALERWTESQGATDPQVLEAASYCGLLLSARGQFAEAAELNQRTLELRRQVSGDNSEETIVARLRVAADTRAKGDFKSALALNNEIYQLAKANYGDADPITLQAAHELAVSERLCGDYRRAFELDQRTSQQRAEVFGYDNVDTLDSLSGLFMDRRELGDYPLARAEHERIARRLQDLLGEDKTDTLRRFSYLAVARRKDGDHEGALELSTRVVELYSRRYGENHPLTMTCAIDHTNDLRHAGDLDGARELGQHTFEQYRDKLGESHPHTPLAAANLAVTLRVSGEAHAARELTERSLELLTQALGADHPHAIACAINLASDVAALGDPEAARTLGFEATERARRMLGADHPTTLAANLNQAFDLRSLGRTTEAETLYADVVTRFRQTLGETHPGTIAAVHGLRANNDIDPLPF